MKTIDLVQGSESWQAHRLSHFNASDAPAMMGCSPHESRNQLIRRLATGIKPEVDAATQRRFDEGHRIEALARKLAEDIIGEDLYPAVGTEGKFSASFDGLTMDESTAFEHKTMNAELRAAFADIETVAPEYRNAQASKLLPLMYRVQMEHQFLVSSGAEKCLFMASKWNGEKLVEERHCWYIPGLDLRAQIIAGWEQLEADVAAYVPTELAAPVLAAPTLGLPAVSIQVNGSIALIDNLDMYGDALATYIRRINLKPQTDQDFADLEGVVKTLKKEEDALEAAESSALAQTASIDTMRRQVGQYKELARTNRLLAEKLVKFEKENRKAAIVMAGKDAFDAHVAGLNASIGKPYMPFIGVDFGAAAKGLKTIDSMQNAVDTTLAKAKISANALCADIRKNLITLRTEAKGYEPLFADVAQLVLKDADDLMAVIATRISTQKAKEAAKAEADRVASEARTAALIEAETLRIREEERIKAEQKALASAPPAIAPLAQMPVAIPPPLADKRSKASGTNASKPTDIQMVEVLALHYRVHESKVLEWLCAIDTAALSSQIETEFA